MAGRLSDFSCCGNFHHGHCSHVLSCDVRHQVPYVRFLWTCKSTGDACALEQESVVGLEHRKICF